MKKAAVILLALAMFFLTGCAAINAVKKMRESPLDAQVFAEIAIAHGFEVQETTELYNSPIIELSLVAEKDEYTVEFVVFSHSGDAYQSFDQIKRGADAQKGGVSSWSLSSDENRA